MQVEGVGKVSLINLVDVVSRLKAESYPSLETTNPALPDYQLALRRAFLTYGLQSHPAALATGLLRVLLLLVSCLPPLEGHHGRGESAV